MVVLSSHSNGKHSVVPILHAVYFEEKAMKVINPWCRIAWFLEAQRNGKFKYEFIPHKLRSTIAMHSMYWRRR